MQEDVAGSFVEGVAIEKVIPDSEELFFENCETETALQRVVRLREHFEKLKAEFPHRELSLAIDDITKCLIETERHIKFADVCLADIKEKAEKKLEAEAKAVG